MKKLPMRMPRPVKHRRLQGFTLIELMIVVAIVAIIATLAFPSYRDSILKGRRAEARAAILDLLQQQERYMTQRGTYLAFTTAANGTVSPTTASDAFKTFSGDSSTNPSYRLSAEVCPNPAGGTFSAQDCIRVVAAPNGNDPAAGSLRMTTTGVRDCTGTTTNPKVCWP